MQAGYTLIQPSRLAWIVQQALVRYRRRALFCSGLVGYAGGMAGEISRQAAMILF